jgi:hypothetical protein
VVGAEEIRINAKSVVANIRDCFASLAMTTFIICHCEEARMTGLRGNLDFAIFNAVREE